MNDKYLQFMLEQNFIHVERDVILKHEVFKNELINIKDRIEISIIPFLHDLLQMSHFIHKNNFYLINMNNFYKRTELHIFYETLRLRNT